MAKYKVIAASTVTVGEFKKLIEDLPNDYLMSWCGMDDGFINISHEEKRVTFDTENLNEYCGYDDEE